MSKKTIIALTGGMGSGKTTIANIFSLYGIPVYNADERSKILVDTEARIIIELKKLFSEDIYINNKLNKKLLAQQIFHDEEMLQKVNNIIHPNVKKDFLDWVNRQVQQFVILETAILFESKFNQLVDVIISINTPLEERIQRCISRDNLSRQEIEARINNQLPDELRNQSSDYIIINDNQHSVIEQVDQIFSEIQQSNK